MMLIQRWPALFTSALALAACQPAANQAAGPVPAADAASWKPGLDTPRKQVSYMVGLDLARNLLPVSDEVDIDTVVLALRAAHAGEPLLLDATQADAVRKQFTEHLRVKREKEQIAIAAKNAEAGQAFLTDNARHSGIVTTDSGLQYRILRAAHGAQPKASDTVRVNYIGRQLNGAKFEDTYAIDHPASFALNQVMPGLGEGIQLMPVGAKYQFWLPAKLAYAERGLAGQIEPNATLEFEVELLEIAGPGVSRTE